MAISELRFSCDVVPGERFPLGDFCILIFYDVVPGEQFLHGDFRSPIFL